MAVGLAIAAGASALIGLVQLYKAEKARDAEKKRLDEIEELFNSLKPPSYDLSIEDPPELHDEKLKLPEFSGPRSAPKWNLEKLEPEQLRQVDKFIPQIAPMILEAEPKLLEKSDEMKRGLDAQKQALRRFMDIGEGDGDDPLLAQRLQDAKQRAQSEAQSRSESIMQDFERRGLGGSGMELAAKIGASSQAMDRNAQLGLAAEAEAYRNQLNALAQGAQLGGQIYGQEQSMQARNADIINAFNQRMSKRHQDWEAMKADALNRADLANIQEAQRIADFNTMGRNEAARMHQGRMDDITRFDYGAGTRERDRSDELGRWRYGAEGKERAYQDQSEILRKQWARDNTDRRNLLEDKRFQNQQDIIRGKAGISGQQSAADIGRAQDRNAAIQGLSNLGMSYGMQQSGQQHEMDMYDKYGVKKRGDYY